LDKYILDFEKPIVELERKIAEMKELFKSGQVSAGDEIKKLETKAKNMRQNIFAKLGSWERVQLARHPMRPYSLDYINRMVEDFQEVHGDRRFSDDKAIVAGSGKIGNHWMAVIGHQKGRGTRDNLKRNFGMPNPEGYRKALRVMELADKFNRPILTLIDTPGAYPGLGAEERGQAEAIAHNLFRMSEFKVPIIAVVIGEGGSGGALALGVADRVMMLENSIYSVISPEGCASILYRDATKNQLAAEALKITSLDLKENKLIDRIIQEPVGGAHQNYDEAASRLKTAVLEELSTLTAIDPDELVENRREKFRRMGFWKEK